MATEVRLLGWKSEGLRCPDCEVTFEREEGGAHPLVLLQMPNGTGKTTTLQLLRVALSGENPWGSNSNEVQQLRKTRRGKDGTVCFESESGEFQVRLLHNGRPLTVTLTFDFELGEVRYSTTLPSSGLQAGFHPPRDLRQFFRSAFVRLFVFDGELASQLLDARHTDASRAIEDLFQLDLFQKISRYVEEYWERETNGRTARTEQGMNRRRNRLDKLKRRIAEVSEKAESNRADLAALRETLTRKKRRYENAFAEQTTINERLQEAVAEFEKASASVQAASQRALQHIRSPHALCPSFGVEMISLKEHLDRVKLPESASREFFQELSEEDKCVCGRPIDDEAKAAIVDRASRYLGSDDVALLNALKSEVAAALGEDPENSSHRLDSLLRVLLEAVELENKARTERELVEREGVQDNPELKALMDEIQELEGRCRVLQERVEEYDASTDSASDEEVLSLKELRRRKEKAETEYAEITHTLALKEKRDVLTNLLRDSQAQARRALSRQICEEANERISALMPHNDIRIGGVDRSISLEGKKRGSEGETLAVAYAFLATLFERADFRLPFVVDSPTGKIDFAIRREIGGFIPRLAEQFVAFTTSSERPEFVPALEKAAADVLYLTLFRKGNTDLDELARREGAVETDDGLLVEGRGFFNVFQLDAEAPDAV
jgi:DNA sulfur modification protein DndD